MSGIAGIVRLDGAAVSPVMDGPTLRDLTDPIAHRGPDDEQFHFWANVGLGFRRLSIVDPEGGRQPLFNRTRTVVLICNGEIYNHRKLRARFASCHRFRSGSDCEIISHLYDEMGMAHLDQLNGIFAFALLDKSKNKLYLCRDRLGVKPLFYYHDPKILVFGSEIKAVLAHPAVPKRFNWAGALTFRDRMHYPHLSHELTSFFEGVQYLPAGRYLEIELNSGAIREQSYWDPAAAAVQASTGELDRQSCVQRYCDLLEDAVRLQLMADVPCGVFLSGGINSLAVAYFASQHKNLHAFSVLSQSTLANGDAPAADAGARSFKLPHHMVLLDWRELDLSPSLWRAILWKLETPIAGAEQFYKHLLYVHAQRRIPGLKIMLLGTGSDEFNGGYSKGAFNTADDPSWHKFERILEGYERDSLLQQSSAWNAYANISVGDRMLISQDFLAALAHQRRYETPWYGCRDKYRRLIQSQPLWLEDRSSAAHGIVARVPFLDHRLVELTYEIPAGLHSDLFWDKTILREAVAGRLADELRCRPKTSFFVGEEQRHSRRLMYNMLCADRCAVLEQAIEEAARCAGVVDQDALWQLFRELPEDPEYAKVDLVLDLVNMGLLAAMAKAPAKPQAFDGPLSVTEVSVEDWSAWEQRFGVSPVQRTPALGRDSVVRFADGIRIVKSEAGDPRMIDDGGYYILRNDDLEFSIEPTLEPWMKFLRLVDGVRSVGDILKAARLTDVDVWKHLEEAIEYDVLNVVPIAH